MILHTFFENAPDKLIFATGKIFILLSNFICSKCFSAIHDTGLPVSIRHSYLDFSISTHIRGLLNTLLFTILFSLVLPVMSKIRSENSTQQLDTGPDIFELHVSFPKSILLCHYSHSAVHARRLLPLSSLIRSLDFLVN